MSPYNRWGKSYPSLAGSAQYSGRPSATKRERVNWRLQHWMRHGRREQQLHWRHFPPQHKLACDHQVMPKVSLRSWLDCEFGKYHQLLTASRGRWYKEHTAGGWLRCLYYLRQWLIPNIAASRSCCTRHWHLEVSQNCFASKRSRVSVPIEGK